MNRPRRSIQHTSYEEPSDSDSQDEGSLSSMSDSSDDSLSVATASAEEMDYIGEIVQLPTASEIVETQQIIRTRMTELAAFKLEYDEVKQKLELIETKCHTITREILESKAYLARVRALPREVLSLVFLFYTEDPSQSPWTLMQVTRTWRATALCTRAIWTKIMITSVIWKEQGQERSYQGREVCVSQQQLGRALRRAGNSPLDILVDCDQGFGFDRRRRASEQDVRGFREMVSLLSSPHRCSLIRHFEVQGLFVPRLLGATTSWNFPALETLILSDAASTQMAEALLKSSKRIKKLSTTATAFLCYADLAVPSELRDVRIFVQASISLEQARSLRGCLQGTLLLTALEINYLKHHPSIPATTITLPNLQILELHRTSLVWYLDAPSLTSLTCSGGSVFREGPTGSNKFPLLKPLKSYGDINWEESLRGVPLPLLRDLDIFCVTRPPVDAFLEFIFNHCHRLATFRLSLASIVKKDLFDLVCSMPLLEELQLERVPIAKGFFTLFMPPKVPSKKPAALPLNLHRSFPRLARLKVDLLVCSLRGQKDAIKAEAKRVIKARVKAGIAMETALIRFSQEEGWINLLPNSPQFL